MTVLFFALAAPAAAQGAMPEPASEPYMGSGDMGQVMYLLRQNAPLLALGVLLIAAVIGYAVYRSRRRTTPSAAPSPAPSIKPPPPSPYGAGGASDPGLRHYFISHASENAAEAMKLVTALEQAGLRCWIAPRNIRAGETYGDAIGAAVARLTKATLVLVSPQAEVSAGVKSELELARRYNHPIVPVILNNHPPGKGMLYYIGTSHWLPFDDAGPATIEALVDAVRD
jgi:hypothetical protein